MPDVNMIKASSLKRGPDTTGRAESAAKTQVAIAQNDCFFTVRATRNRNAVSESFEYRSHFAGRVTN